MQHQFKPTDLRTRIFLIYALSLSVLSVLVLGYGSYFVSREYTEEIIDRELTRTEFADRLFMREITGIRQNILAASEMPPIQGIVRASNAVADFDTVGNTGLEFWKNRLEQIFTTFIASRTLFHQFRLIGVADGGREIVRVERRGKDVYVVPEQELQRKGQRNYFEDTVALRPGEVYLSRINLNREWGKVEVPHRPTVRAATPVFGEDGKLFGILIANMDMTIPLQNLATDPAKGVRSYLVDENGDFLVHPDPAKTFGFDLGKRYRWQDEFPEVPLLEFLPSSPEQMFQAHPFKLGGKAAAMTAMHFDPLNPARRFYLIHAAEKSVLDALTSREFAALVAATLLVALTLGGLISVYLRRMLNPLQQLAGAARDIGLGHYDINLPKADVAEVNILVDAFREMMEKLDIRENAPVMMHTLDEDGNILTANDAWLETLGYAHDEVIGHRLSHFMTPDSRTKARAFSFPTLVKTGKLRNIDYELVCADGRVVNVVLSADVVRDSAGKFVMGLSVCTDVTQQKRFEAALLESEGRFRQAFDSAAHGIALVDLNGDWVDLNEKFCALLGYDRKQLMALNFDAVCHPDDADKDAGLAADLIAGKIASYQSEMRFLHKDDTTVPTLLSVGLVRDHQKRPVHFVTQIVDMSALREVEAKYVHAQKMEAVGNLTGGIAHDFNNLLGVILGNMQLLQRRVKDDETLTGFVDAAISATRKGSDLTRHLLAFSRRQELSPQVLNANRLVTSMGEILQRTIGAEIEIATELDDNIPRVKADATQLESAILNLAINARDAMPNGGRLEIKTAGVDVGKKDVTIFGLDRPGTYVSITVTDTGEGMSPEIQKTIFEPFFTTKEVGKGSGLGLSMVYGFVTQSGGNIRVYSEPGMGTRFQLLLPSADPDCTPHPVPRPDHQDSETPTGTETILLVEDDPAFRKTAIQLLEDLGYRVISAVDGPGALQAFDATPGIDMVLTDMVMPGGMNGHQLADHLRARAPDLPILLTSGYPRDSFSDGRRYELLQKPYTEKALAHAIRDALAASGGGETPTTP